MIGKVPTVEFDLLVVLFYFGFGWARCAMVVSKVSPREPFKHVLADFAR